MIFNRDLLFVHVPKTGGMAVTAHLLKVLPRPVYYSLPERDERIADPGVIQMAGLRHESLAEAAGIMARYGFDIRKLPVILAAIRNPYALEVSRYAYLQKAYPWNDGHNQRLALEEDFEAFAVESFDHAGHTRPIQAYFELDGVMPANLRILRAESLGDDLAAALTGLGLPGGAIPRDNESEHEPFEQYYTRAAEEAVYRRYRWVFDKGFYPRLAAGFAFVETSPCRGPALPLGGPVRQVSLAHGYWPDGWVSRGLGCRIRASEAIQCLTVSGTVPHAFAGGLKIKITINDSMMQATLAERGDFQFDLPCRIPPGRSASVAIDASDAFCPRSLCINEDTRELSFVLRGLDFQPAGGEA